MSNNSIPEFLAKTEFGSIIQNEIDFKDSLKLNIDSFKNEFSISSNYLLILKLLSTLLRIEVNKTDDIVNLKEKLNAVRDAFRNPGTYDSIIALYKVFLGVEIDFLNYEDTPGELEIKPRSNPRFTTKTVIKSSATNTAFYVRHRGEKAILILNKSDRYFIDSFKAFIKTFILAGVTLGTHHAGLITKTVIKSSHTNTAFYIRHRGKRYVLTLHYKHKIK